MTPPASSQLRFAVCVETGTYHTSLEQRKVYCILPDPPSEARGQLRVVDDSGEDYLYPRDWFVFVELPAELKERLAAAPTKP